MFDCRTTFFWVNRYFCTISILCSQFYASRTLVLSDSHRRTIRNKCWPFCFIPLMMKRAKRESSQSDLLCTFTAPSSIKTRSWHPASSLRWKFESSRICIARTRELPGASRDGRIAGKLIKSAPRTFIIDVLTITNVIVLFLNKAFSILRSFRY